MPEAAVQEQLDSLVEDHDPAAEWQRTVACFGTYVREGPGGDPGAEVARRVESCLLEGRPGSFVRLADGEGNVLAASFEDRPELTRWCLRATATRHLGGSEELAQALPQLLPRYAHTLRNANLIGFPGPFGVGLALRGPRPRIRAAQGILSVHRYLQANSSRLGLARKTGAPAGFHRALHPHYARLLEGRRIGIVTGHPELADALRLRMGAAEVDLRPVPRQARHVRGAATAGSTGHWPGRFRELLLELREVRAGTLWLVAAGILGKVYCEVIRGAGAVALDIGHVADVWAGRATRDYDQREALEAWRIVEPSG